MKKLFFVVLVVLASTSCNEKDQAQITAKVAERIIERAQEIVHLYDNPQAVSLLQQGLSSMTVHKTDKKGYVEFPNTQGFVFLLTDGNNFSARQAKEKCTVMRFEWQQMSETHHVVISADNNACGFVLNEDALACILIHELVHAIQHNTRLMNGISIHDVSAFADEVEAWKVQTDIFFALHPQYENFTVNGCEGGGNITTHYTFPEEDRLLSEMIKHRACGSEFLKTLYDPTK